MINYSDPKILCFKEKVHINLIGKSSRSGIPKDDIILANRIFFVICKDSSMEPTEIAITVNNKFGMDINAMNVISIFRKNHVANPKERKDLFDWAAKCIDLFEKALSGDKGAYEAFEKMRKESFRPDLPKNTSQQRILVSMIFNKLPKIFERDDFDRFNLLGDTLAKYFFYDISDSLKEFFENGVRTKTCAGETKVVKVSDIQLEKMKKRIQHLEEKLDQSKAMLQDLQDEFDKQLTESRIQELTEFFSSLNSEKYGCLLDGLLSIKRGVDNLRKGGYELPVEISGLFILVTKLIQFIRDNHIEPIMKVDSIMDVKASDIELCDYSGSAFEDENEIHKIKVLSPGWVYKDKEIQIAPPKVMEVEDDN